MRLGDDLFLMALDDRTGRLRLEPGALGIGLAGALLTELMLANSISISTDTDRVHVHRHSAPPDSLTHAVTELLAAEPQHALRTWIMFLARDATGKVAERLVRERIIRKVESRSLLRGLTVSYPPVDDGAVAWRLVRLAKLIDERAVTDWSDCLLTALAQATGLTRVVLRDVSGNAKTYLDWLTGQLERDPGLQALIACVTSAVAGRTVTR
jgi:hypothetical protein